MRNLRAVTNREQRSLAEDQASAASEPLVRKELDDLAVRQREAQELLDKISETLPNVEAGHEAARLRFLTLEQQREARYRELERVKLLAVNAQMPGVSDSSRYIFAQLLTEADCLVCGNNVPSFKETMESRIRDEVCVVCGSTLTESLGQPALEPGNQSTTESELNLQYTDAELENARTALLELEEQRRLTAHRIQELQATITARTARVETLLGQLPPEESNLHERRSELGSLRARIEVLQREVDEKRIAFKQVITAANMTVEDQALAIQSSFSDFAHEFLFEDCRLLWSPHRARLGQAGIAYDFPAFELELGGSDFMGIFRRHGPSDVSESQRAFIDLSFRMALAKVAARDEVSSLVMDAPEASLDMVFVDRAAGVLGTFGSRKAKNRLVVTSNLVAGRLIPELLRKAAVQGDRSNRVVDLLAIATPTAAVRDYRAEYDKAREQLLAEANAPN